jgi:hypothetical protein
MVRPSYVALIHNYSLYSHRSHIYTQVSKADEGIIAGRAEKRSHFQRPSSGMRQLYECNITRSLSNVGGWREVLEDERDVHKGKYSELSALQGLMMLLTCALAQIKYFRIADAILDQAMDDQEKSRALNRQRGGGRGQLSLSSSP